MRLSWGLSRHVRTCHTRHDVGMLNKDRGGGPKVVLATLASLEAGLARQLFIEWARDSKNLIVFPLQAQVLSKLLCAGAVFHQIVMR